jgi:hypothetical protein
MSDARFHQPIFVISDEGEISVGTAHEAYELLTAKWPNARGKWYHAAARACRSASAGNTSPHIARRMFLNAASEARLSAR